MFRCIYCIWLPIGANNNDKLCSNAQCKHLCRFLDPFYLFLVEIVSNGCSGALLDSWHIRKKFFNFILDVCNSFCTVLVDRSFDRRLFKLQFWVVFDSYSAFVCVILVVVRPSFFISRYRNSFGFYTFVLIAGRSLYFRNCVLFLLKASLESKFLNID